MAKIKKEEIAIDESGPNTRRYSTRPGYAERIKKEKIEDAVDDTPEIKGTDSGV